MAVRKKKTPPKVVKRRKPKASVNTMIKRYKAKLERLRNRQKLAQIKQEVKDLQETVKAEEEKLK